MANIRIERTLKQKKRVHMSLGRSLGLYIPPVDQSLSREFLNPTLEPLHHNAVESVVVPAGDLFAWTNLDTSYHRFLATSLVRSNC
jgi:hypothetical protein